MKQELASIFPEVSVSDSLAPAVAATSSISVPDWMKPGVGSFTGASLRSRLCSARVSAVWVSLARGRKSAGNLLWHDELDRLRTRHSNWALRRDDNSREPLQSNSSIAEKRLRLRAADARHCDGARREPVRSLPEHAWAVPDTSASSSISSGRVQLALAAYNAGPGRVRGGLVPRITETQAYVTDIIANWSRLTAAPGSQALRSTLPQPAYRSVALAQF